MTPQEGSAGKPPRNGGLPWSRGFVPGFSAGVTKPCRPGLFPHTNDRTTMALKKSELYSSLWQSCDELRGGMDASQYKDYVLTLLFVKYAVSYTHLTLPTNWTV